MITSSNSFGSISEYHAYTWFTGFGSSCGIAAMIEDGLVPLAISFPPPNNSTSLSSFLLMVSLIILLCLLKNCISYIKYPLTFHCQSLGISFSTLAALLQRVSYTFPLLASKIKLSGRWQYWFISKAKKVRGAWVAQSVRYLISTQVMILLLSLESACPCAPPSVSVIHSFIHS